ncbi:MAG: NAD-dependent epimerase/dehydratase family protein [Halioglobus sp.]|nr:NAD-dependent epimerase/dehydratase family protein [Halioglobus sp.]
MRVMLTGGTGFVGYHTTMALLEAGHEVSLLVRSVDKMIDIYGADTIGSFTRGDICDPASVRAAVDGCDAVVHAAAMVSVDPRDAERVYSTNVEGTRIVIGAALDAGAETIVHVSSVTALFDPKASVLNEQSPPGRARNAYGRSKVECEHFVRRLQAGGAPLYVTYPASIIGPQDPGLTEPHVGLRAFLAVGGVPLLPTGNQWVDVRDVAAAHLRLLEQPPEPRRFTLGGHYLAWRELAAELEAITGRRLLKFPMSGVAMRLAGTALDLVRSRVPVDVDVPVTREAMEYATRWVPLDNTLAEQTLDVSFRPVRESLREAIRWLYREGHISRRQAGRALDDAD